MQPHDFTTYSRAVLLRALRDAVGAYGGYADSDEGMASFLNRAKREQELLEIYDPCGVCGEPREPVNGSLVCTDNPQHDPHAS